MEQSQSVRGDPDAGGPIAPMHLPLRMEMDAVRRILHALHLTGRACLDIGFRHPQVCKALRQTGGYWTSVSSADSCGQADLALALGAATIVSMSANGTLPFEDKQFDVLVLALGSLKGDPEADAALIRECHRVLKVPGYLILTVEFIRPFALADLFYHRRQVTGTGGRYSETQLFELLKPGFDWLGMRPFCRFWVQMVRQWADQKGLSSSSETRLAFYYWIAKQCDRLLFFSGGYVVTSYGRRKGWRVRQSISSGDRTVMPGAVLRQRRQ
jgi:SAM-dependent methyltransferase